MRPLHRSDNAQQYVAVSHISHKLGSPERMSIAAALALGGILGLIILAVGPVMALGAVTGVALAATAFTYPEVAILMVLCFASGLMPSQLNLFVRLPVGRFQASDLLLIWLLFVVLLRVFVNGPSSYRRTPLDIPLVLFYGAVVLGFVTAVVQFGVNVSDATYEARMLMYYLIFFPITNMIRTQAQLVRLAGGVMVVGALLAGVMLLQSTLGNSFPLMDEYWRVSAQGSEVARAFHPGFTVVYFALIALICHSALGRLGHYPLLRWMQILLLGTGLMATLARNIIISGAAGFVLLIGALRASERSRLARNLLWVTVVAVVLTTALVVAGLASSAGEYFDAYAMRLDRMFSVEILTPGENLWPRWREIQFALAKIEQYPIFGIGLYNPYRPSFDRYEPEGLRHYLHFGYLSLWLKTGIIGLTSFLWLSAVYLRRGFRHWRGVQDAFLRSAVLGFAIAYVGMMLSNMVAPSFTDPGSLVIFGVVLGLSEAVLAHGGATEGLKIGGASREAQDTTICS
jgi:O-antigen ligase